MYLLRAGTRAAPNDVEVRPRADGRHHGWALVTCPCFARVERFRWRVFLVRQFPGSLSNSARGLLGPSAAPLGHSPLTLTLGCDIDIGLRPLTFLSKYCTDVVRPARDLISRRVGLSPLDASRSPTLLSLYR